MLTHRGRLGSSAWLVVVAAIGVTIGLLFGKASAPIALLALGVGALGAVVILASPEVGLLAIVFTTYVGLSNVLIQFHGAPSIAKILAPLVLLAILLRWARTGERPAGWRQPALLVSIYGVACTVSLFAARDPGLTLSGLTTLAKNGLIFIIVVTLVQGATTLRRVAWALIAAAVFMGTVSVHQQLTGNFDFDYWGFGQTPVAFSFEGERTIRVAGPIGHPNFYGMIFLVIVPLAIDRLQFETRPVLKIVSFWALLVSVLTIVFTYSRSALVSLVVLLGLIVLVRRPRPAQLLAAVLVVIVLVPLLPSGYSERLFQLADSVAELNETGTTREGSVRGRLSENLVATEMFLDHPIVGVGLANFPARYQDYSQRLGLDPRRKDRQPHNLYLEILSETGLIGLAAFGLVLWAALRGVLASRRGLLHAGRTDLARLIEAIALGFTGYLIASVFLHASHPRYFWLLAGITLALPQVARSELARDPAEELN